MQKIYCVYLLASKKNGTLYCGVTSDLPQRIFEHKHEIYPGFTSKYDVKRLVWFESLASIADAIQREKTIKKYPRQWKINLIEANNPEWKEIDPVYGQVIRYGKDKYRLANGLPGQAR